MLRATPLVIYIAGLIFRADVYPLKLVSLEGIEPSAFGFRILSKSFEAQLPRDIFTLFIRLRVNLKASTRASLNAIASSSFTKNSVSDYISMSMGSHRESLTIPPNHWRVFEYPHSNLSSMLIDM